MGADQPEPPGAGTGMVKLVVGGVIVTLLGAGWFILSHFVMNTSSSDAAAEALGVVLALMIVASVMGAVASGRGKPG